MEQEKRLKRGLTISLCGLGVAVASTVFYDIVYMFVGLILGSAIYLPGSYLVFVGPKSPERSKYQNQLRMVRLGFGAVFLVMIFKIIKMS